MNAALLSSVKHDWRTPRVVLDLVREFAAGPIALDPATSPDNPTGAATFFTEADNGLLRPWHTDGLIYVNPPYGRALAPWARRIANEGQHIEIIALLPARPDTKWWQDHVIKTCDALCFWRGRLKFVDAPAPAPFPSALAYWGPRAQRFCEVFEGAGYCLKRELR